MFVYYPKVCEIFLIALTHSPYFRYCEGTQWMKCSKCTNASHADCLTPPVTHTSPFTTWQCPHHIALDTPKVSNANILVARWSLWHCDSQYWNKLSYLGVILSSTIDDYKVHSYRTRAGPPPLNTELTPESITTNFIHRINRCVCVCVCVCVWMSEKLNEVN